MLNKLTAFIREQGMLQWGQRIVCAVSGGADSMALLWAMYLLREKLEITLEAAHFNHGLRGDDSDGDEAFVRQFCADYGIPLHCGSAQVIPGKKGLEAAARDARYSFLLTLDGTIATAHTANDNAETVLMHMVRGTGLKGLGAIAPVSGKLIRPMLRITRQEVLAFLEEYHVPHIHDRSNDSDAFLRNRLRHHVMPLLEQENPRLALNLSDMALRLRQDEALLQEVTQARDTLEVAPLLELPPALRSRAIANFLTACGMKEPAANHISLVEKLARSNNPSAKADLPGGICVCRDYGILRKYCPIPPLRTLALPCPGSIDLPEQRLRVICREANALQDRSDCFTVQPHGALILRCRSAGDTITLHGGTKSLKALFIDRKIPADQRLQIPVIADDAGLVGVYGFGVDRRRLAENLPAVEICFQSL